MKEGLLDEVRSLARDPRIWHCAGFKGIGYKEWRPYFEEKADVSECVEAIKKNSRNFAKRQYTWFRNQLEVQWYDVKEPNWKEQCMRQLQEWRKQ